MTRYLAIAALMTACGTAEAVEDDKKLHFGMSAVVGFAAVNQWPDNRLLAFGVAMIPGLLKETMDAQSGGTGFSGKDMAANALGAAVGVLTGGLLIHYTRGVTTVAYATTF